MNYSKELPDLARFHSVEILPLATETVPPYTTTNTILYGKKDFFLIDPATKDPAHQDFLKQHINNRLSQGHALLGVLLTHHHADHIGAAELIRSTFHVPVMAHHALAHKVDFKIDTSIDENYRVSLNSHYSLRVLYTPGHADSHLVFLDEKEGCLIAGDMITDRGTILIPPNSGSLKLYLLNLNRLTTLPLKMIIPAHGKAIIVKPQQFLLNAIKHRLERIEQIYSLLKKAPTLIDATDITNAAYKRNIEDNLMFFAQLSVESSLYWLKENHLAAFENYRWRLTDHKVSEKERLILDPLKEIDERLRHT